MIHQLAIRTVFELLALHGFAPQRYPHLLENTATGNQGRYDILFAFPGESLLPVASATRFSAAVIRDRLQQRCRVVAEDSDHLHAIREMAA